MYDFTDTLVYLVPVVIVMVPAEFPTTSMEMQAVADQFDRDGDGFIDYKEFIAALRPERADVCIHRSYTAAR